MDDIELRNLPERAKAWKKNNKSRLRKLRTHKQLTVLAHDVHDKVFAFRDCLKCANCCKTTGPLFLDRDIERIAKHLNLTYHEFVNQYLRKDEDGDMVLQKLPCPFLEPDNRCRIYPVRPKACSEYPHTDANHQNRIFSLTLKNAEICPAVLDILQGILTTFDKENKGI